MTAVEQLRAYLIACGVLLLLVVIEWLPAGEPEALPAPVALHAARVEVGLEPKQTGAWAQTINHRPLFAVNRKPVKTATVGGITTDTGLPRLAGIMITPAGRRAIFMPDGGKPATLAEGAVLDDDTIRQILADRVVLTGPKGDITLRPTYDKQHAGAGSLIAPTPPGLPPGFPNPGFNPGFPNPGFNPQAFQPPAFTPQPQPQPNGSDDNSDNQPVTAPAAGVPVPFPGFRGPIPRGRE